MAQATRHILVVGGETITVSALGKALGVAKFRVSMVNTAPEALNVLASSGVDLVLCDVRQSGLEDLFRTQSGSMNSLSRAAPFLFFGDPRWPASALLAEEKKVARFISLPTDGQTLLNKVRELLEGTAPHPPVAAPVSRAPRAPAPTPVPEKPGRDVDLAGNLSVMPVENLLQFFEQSRQIGRLRLSTERFTGHIYIVEGQVHHATLGEVDGAEAVYLLVNLREGRFDFQVDIVPDKRTIDMNIASLLLEGLRQRDETISIVTNYKQKRETGIMPPR